MVMCASFFVFLVIKGLLAFAQDELDYVCIKDGHLIWHMPGYRGSQGQVAMSCVYRVRVHSQRSLVLELEGEPNQTIRFPFVGTKIHAHLKANYPSIWLEYFESRVMTRFGEISWLTLRLKAARTEDRARSYSQRWFL